MPKHKLNYLILIVLNFFMTSEAKVVPVVTQELVEFLPSGFYRKLSGDNIKCPAGHFSWLQNNQMLTIGGAHPVIFHTFNSSETRTISQKPKCTANTQNHIKNTSQGKIINLSIAQYVTSDCENATNTSEQILVVSKVKGKTTVDLSIQVKRMSPKKKTEPIVYCKYETGPN